MLERPGWVIDGDYRRLLGDAVLARAELAVWLDLPLRVSLARMWRRTRARRLRWDAALLRWVVHEVVSHLRRRVTMEPRLARHPVLEVVHLRSQAQVDAWLG